jgi:hypothetical protein
MTDKEEEPSLEEKIKSAEAKIQKVLMNWFTEDAILMNLWSQFNFKPDPNQETLGINITGRHPLITFNPNFVNAIPLEYLEPIMVNTSFKILLRHCTSRLREPRQISALSSNISVDELIYQNSLNLLANDPSLKDLVPTAKQFNLPEKECFEEYFRQLYDKQKEINDMIKTIWDSMTDEEKDKLINQPPQGSSGKGKGTPQEQQSDGEEQSDSKEEGKDKDGFKEYNDKEEGIKDYFDPNGTANDGWGQNDMMDSDIKNFVEKNKDRVKAWGKHTGNFVSEIIAAQESSFSFKDVIRRFKKSVTTFKTEATRMKLNRRYNDTLIFPGHRRQNTTRIIFAVDESGSMSNEDLAEGFAVINKICKHVEISYITFDTEVKQVEKDFKKAKNMFKVSGRGGTSPKCVFEWIDKQKTKYDGCIIFTDGYFDTNIKEPEVSVLWLLHSKNMTVPVKWGMVTTLDRFENNHIW